MSWLFIHPCLHLPPTDSTSHRLHSSGPNNNVGTTHLHTADGICKHTFARERRCLHSPPHHQMNDDGHEEWVWKRWSARLFKHECVVPPFMTCVFGRRCTSPSPLPPFSALLLLIVHVGATKMTIQLEIDVARRKFSLYMELYILD